MPQLEVMIDVLTLEYGAKDDANLAKLMAKYFEVDEADAIQTLNAYREYKGEDFEQLSKKQEYYARV